ncbi:MAG TPA: methyltransferase domain-containing protein [Oligoflexia bacterium]|nr:methyltransferase domain-containing protein [Oligoflexia bacterium]HMP48048.1 methyltransferase domain-containing protein [Oligoflexia bacterium]
MITSSRRDISRREAIRYLISGAMAVFSSTYTTIGFADSDGFMGSDGNFRGIYLDPKLRNEFFLFLKNVFRLYPEEDLHNLIFGKVQKLNSDKDIYNAIVQGLPDIKPFLSEIRYALPSLKKQKEVMCKQTVSLLDGKKSFGGYLEIGSTGRYYDKLKEELKFSTRPIFINDIRPSYAPSDVIDRGRVRKYGDFVPLYDYASISPDQVADESIELLTVYIGFHHAPVEKRDLFIDSCYRVLKKGGILVVRDHDVDSEVMTRFVALAHDVFNAGFELPWESNEAEIRNFTSLIQLEEVLVSRGFQKDERRLLQEGDPTRNALIRFTKI